MPAGLDPRLPVIIGVGQQTNRPDEGHPAVEPVDLMAAALRSAGDDSGVPRVLDGADSVRVIRQLSWSYRDPGALVAERVGATPAETLYTVMGGNYVQTLVNRTARDIQDGRNDLVLLCGGEAWRTRTRARKSGVELSWTGQSDGTAPAVEFGQDEPLSSPAEVERGVFLPVQVYPMFDVALRASLGLGVEEHRNRIARLWADFSEVAATNPQAWIRRSYLAAEIAAPTPANRMVGFPYTKLLNSNNDVDMGAALIMCSVARAEALGVARDRWVFPHAGSDAHDHWFVSNRSDLHSSPAIRVAGRAALDLAGVGAGDIAHIDLYSCFPSAVQVAAAELGLALDRPLTVTGGMSFAGGPWNNYVMHSVATMVAVLREDPGALGLCTANGGFLTKHAFGVYSTDPPLAGRFRHAEPQEEVDALPRREAAPEHTGSVAVESYVVLHDREGTPERALVACLTPTGARAWGSLDEPGILRAMCEEEFVGRAATMREKGSLDLE